MSSTPGFLAHYRLRIGARGLKETDHGRHDSTRRVLLRAGAQQGGRGRPLSDGAPGGRHQPPRVLWLSRRARLPARLRSRRSGRVQAVRADGQVEAHRPQAGLPGEWRGARGCDGRAAPELAEAKINVTAIDAVCAGAGRYGAILWVAPRDMS